MKNTGHNAYLNQGVDESNEDYNKRISDFERKVGGEQFIRCAEDEIIMEMIKAEINHSHERDKNLVHTGEELKLEERYRLALEGMMMRVESLYENRKIIGQMPLDYELKFDGIDTYKLSKRR